MTVCSLVAPGTQYVLNKYVLNEWLSSTVSHGKGRWSSIFLACQHLAAGLPTLDHQPTPLKMRLPDDSPEASVLNHLELATL
jgi:hypothetical protein